MLLQKSPDAVAKQDLESTQVSGRETITGREHSTPREVNRSSSAHVPPAMADHQTASSSLLKPPTSSSAASLVTRTATAEGPRPTGTLASLLHGSQAAEAKAYFTGLLPGRMPPPRPVSANGPKPPAASSNKAVPSFTGFTGKLGSATSGAVPRFEFAAVSITGISALTFFVQ